MLLAKAVAPTIIYDLADWRANEDKTWGFESSRAACRLFDGIETWPSLNRVLHQCALALIARSGIASWRRAGGTRAADGSPSFESRSPVAAAILHQIAVQSGAFRYVDEQGGQWAALLASENPSCTDAWRGLALGGELSPCLLSYPVRENALHAITQQLNDPNQPAVLYADGVDADRLRLSRWRQRLRLLDLGVRMLPRLARTAACHPMQQVAIRVDTLARAAWGPGDHCWPATWESLVFDSIASLSSLQVQVVDLPATGWCPRTISRRPAITSIMQPNRALTRVRFARQFLAFIDHWLDGESEADQFATSVRDAPLANLVLHPLQDVAP